MTACIHALIMKMYAEDAMETDRPWERWQYRVLKVADNELWESCHGHPKWILDHVYRRKPNVIKVTLEDGEVVEFPKPMMTKPAQGMVYYRMYPGSGSTPYRVSTWDDDGYDNHAFDDGMIFATEAEAVAASKAVVKILGGKV